LQQELSLLEIDQETRQKVEERSGARQIREAEAITAAAMLVVVMGHQQGKMRWNQDQSHTLCVSFPATQDRILLAFNQDILQSYSDA
jgi:hypothetical protein